MVKYYTNGKKYLCQTSREKWQDYRGSGSLVIRDRLVLEKTELLGAFETREELRVAGLYWSEALDVVDNPEFLNLTPEEGTGGYTGRYDDSERNRAISRALKGRKRSEKHRANLSRSTKGYVQAYNLRTGEVQRVMKDVFERDSDLVGIAKVRLAGVPKTAEHLDRLRGRVFSDEHRRKLSGPNPLKSRKGPDNGKSRRVVAAGVEYVNLTAAYTALGRNLPWLLRRLRNPAHPDFYYI